MNRLEDLLFWLTRGGALGLLLLIAGCGAKASSERSTEYGPAPSDELETEPAGEGGPADNAQAPA